MRRITTKAHAAIDYVMALTLIIVPLFFLEDGGAAAWVPLIIGCVILLQSLITDYEYSAANLLPVPLHLGMDAVVGILLIASPWIWGFDERVWIPHVVAGVLEIGTAAMTKYHRSEPAKYPNPSTAKAKPAH